MNRRLFPLFAAALALTVAASPASAAAPADAYADEVVAYRAEKWQSAHFDDAEKAQKHAATLKKLGCEVKTGAHGGHTDVSHRCPEWREISLKTHEKAHQWEDWLKANGFETRHAH
ncbi:hypothetical protein [Alienimonas sp. DA493]|uniref:hypothetical protein n=1 Tax=Alienimonas sp. DA493 TaxID=3373605 RepID=UPI003754E26F